MDSATNKTGKMDKSDSKIDNKITYQQNWCPKDRKWWNTIEWDKRTAAITGSDGKVIFQQENVEVPSNWSQLATNIVASKYFYGEKDTKERETSVRQLIQRVCGTIADWGRDDGYFATAEDANRFKNDLCYLALHQYFAFNSPAWFNVGVEERPQTSACFIQSVDDTLDSIMQLAVNEANLFKFGSGTGSDLSSIRSSREKLSGGGKPSGPLSFMRIYNSIAGVVKSGGKTRRAAKMQTLHVSHPDIMEFIEAKSIEERKAKILMEQGYSYEDAYNTIPYQNANLSVRVTDEFMHAVEADEQWETRWVTDKSILGPVYKAKDVFRKIAQCTWECGDPGLQYTTTINDWHTCPKAGPINSSNPCSEYMAIDDSACNLASINLMKFRKNDGTFDAEAFQRVIIPVFIAQEIVIDRSSYPTKKIEDNSHNYRAIGIGYSNLGALLMSFGIPYDSDEGRGLCGGITAILTGTAYRTSALLAKTKGAFKGYAPNKTDMLRVIDKHYHYIKLGKLLAKGCPEYLNQLASQVWEEALILGGENGFRNCQVSVLAPTGTISFMMDCDTTGIEPEIALVKFKQLVGGGTLKIVNQTIPLALDYLGYSEDDRNAITNYIIENGFADGAPQLKPEHLPIFDCAFGKRALSWQSHIKMMAAAQPFISGAISKTVNMPNDATVEDIEQAYMMAWKSGIKGVAIYRDGSKGAQPLNLTDDSSTTASKRQERKERRSRREHLPDTRDAKTHKFVIGGHEGYLTVGHYPDGRPGELFITMSKNGSTIGGLVDCFATAVSLGLQCGVPLKDFVEKFAYNRFEPSGFTKNPSIPHAKSIVDYVFRWLENEYITKPAIEAGETPETPTPAPDSMDDQFSEFQQDSPICDVCGSITVRNGSCYLCHNCGKSMGCS